MKARTDGPPDSFAMVSGDRVPVGEAVGQGAVADGFPAVEFAKTAKSELSKADWVAFSAIGRT
jgi:hypothetical protein